INFRNDIGRLVKSLDETFSIAKSENWLARHPYLEIVYVACSAMFMSAACVYPTCLFYAVVTIFFFGDEYRSWLPPFQFLFISWGLISVYYFYYDLRARRN